MAADARRRRGPAALGLWLLLLAAFALGGSARGDVVGLVLLRPFAVAMLGLGLVGLTRADIRSHRFAFSIAAIMVAWLVLQLVPLPPMLWRGLPGRGVVAAIDDAAGLQGSWRAISLSPDGTRNALFALSVPLAALVLGARLDRRERQRLLPLVMAIAATSAVMGVFQTLNAPSGGLIPAGLFANRNHQALLLAMLLPMLALRAQLAATPTSRALALVATLPLLPLLLVTGSRSGMVCGVLALASMPLVGRGVRLRTLAAGLAMVAMMLAMTVSLGRGLAWDRLSATTPVDELRIEIVPVLLPLLRDQLPLGAGAGSFAKVYQMDEPDRLLSPRYVNHAHDDWLEVLVTDGFVAAALLLAAVTAFGVAAFRAWRPRQAFTAEIGFARLGLVLVLLCGFASLGDYPLRTPALACLFVVATLWAAGARSAPDLARPSQ
ncbi:MULTISPECIES: O-antigen ligase family protein [Novosphingobium]|uniref:O-antigen ligase family protein n=1 Tax=Novosphingobium TaxID=165696 RepID=UPI001CD34D57|nr:O-antigen ligase family protein [Novosphingobium percolationis]MCH7627642.1 O-antigen ligase family protein [Pseudomonadota bacterium]